MRRDPNQRIRLTFQVCRSQAADPHGAGVPMSARMRDGDWPATGANPECCESRPHCGQESANAVEKNVRSAATVSNERDRMNAVLLVLRILRAGFSSIP